MNESKYLDDDMEMNAADLSVEEFIEKRGCSSDTDSYAQDGKLKFVSYSSQHFDVNAVNPYTPAAFSWPSTFTQEEEAYLTSEIQRLMPERLTST